MQGKHSKQNSFENPGTDSPPGHKHIVTAPAEIFRVRKNSSFWREMRTDPAAGRCCFRVIALPQYSSVQIWGLLICFQRGAVGRHTTFAFLPSMVEVEIPFAVSMRGSRSGWSPFPQAYCYFPAVSGILP